MWLVVGGRVGTKILQSPLIKEGSTNHNVLIFAWHDCRDISAHIGEPSVCEAQPKS